MSTHAPLCPPIDLDRLEPVAQARVLYADTDKMGITYHASYLRYMELGRVEFIRNSGMPYARMEEQGLALPLTDVAVRYRSPARYDDKMTVYVGLSLLTRIRVHFDYRFVVAAGDREGLTQDVEILTAHTRHVCVRLQNGSPQRLPPAVYEVLRSCYTDPAD